MSSTLVPPARFAPGKSPSRERLVTVRGWCLEKPVRTAALLALMGALLLQLWRPFFFLTDDNLADWLPISVEASRRLWEGHWPFFNEYLFGGFNLLNDPGVFGLLSPWMLACSFLAITPYYYVIADVVGTLSLVTVATAFCWSALRLRNRFELAISPALIIILSLSYAFTPFNFIVGASWPGFLNAPAALPLIFAGAFEPTCRRALLIQTGALLYALFGGHSHPFTTLLIFSSLLIAAVSMIECSWRITLVWTGAVGLTLILASPVLIPALQGFGQDSRSAGLSVAQASWQNVPATPLIASFLLGPLSSSLLDDIPIDLADPLYNLSIAFALINLPLVGVLLTRRRWYVLEGCLLAGILLTGLCVVRPTWLGATFAQLPLLRSLRWPFREIATLHFFTHTLFLFSFRPAATPLRRRIALGLGMGGALAYGLVFLCVAPTFWLFGPDRRLIVSGEADRYWNEWKRTHPTPVFVVEAPWQVLMPQRPAVPFTLIAGFDYASLFRVANVSGFSATPPPGARWLEAEAKAAPYFWGGVFSPGAARRIMATKPAVQRIVLTGMSPITWQIESDRATEHFQFNSKTGRVQFLPASTQPPPP